jgi:hypothetical protein
MPAKQFWDYIVTVEIKLSAADREEALQIIRKETSTPGFMTIVRVRPVIKK